MSTTTKDLLRAAATVAFAIAAAATTVTNAFAQTTDGKADTAHASHTTDAAPAHALTRAEVEAQVIEARKNGTMIETESDFDVAQTRKQVAK
ncbi:MAG: DUF4148 domain-containing protein [Duganella sp.]